MMTERRADVVIDVGCADHGGDRSIVPLIEHYHPGVLFGIDPQVESATYLHDGTTVILTRAVAWTHDTMMTLSGGGLGMRATEDPDGEWRAFDIAPMIAAFAGRIVLKLDAESAEWEIVPHLVREGSDLSLDRILVEWHCVLCGNGAWAHSPPHPHGTMCDGAVETEARAREVEATVRCPIEGWSL
jgi:hypothetical protein